MRHVRTALCLAIMAILPEVWACSGVGSSGYGGIESGDPGERVKAIIEISECNAVLRIPSLIDRLDDEDEAVRLYAILALEQMTGTRRGYSYADPPGERAQAISDWRIWLAKSSARGETSERSEGDVQSGGSGE